MFFRWNYPDQFHRYFSEQLSPDTLSRQGCSRDGRVQPVCQEKMQERSERPDAIFSIVALLRTNMVF